MKGFRGKPISRKNNEQGATTVEYCLIAALIAIALIAVIQMWAKPSDSVDNGSSYQPTSAE